MEEAHEIYLLSYFRLQHINSLPHRYQTINEPLFNKGFPATRKILLIFKKIKQINMGTEKDLSHETLQGPLCHCGTEVPELTKTSLWTLCAAADHDLLT